MFKKLRGLFGGVDDRNTPTGENNPKGTQEKIDQIRDDSKQQVHQSLTGVGDLNSHIQQRVQEAQRKEKIREKRKRRGRKDFEKMRIEALKDEYQDVISFFLEENWIDFAEFFKLGAVNIPFGCSILIKYDNSTSIKFIHTSMKEKIAAFLRLPEQKDLGVNTSYLSIYSNGQRYESIHYEFIEIDELPTYRRYYENS